MLITLRNAELQDCRDVWLWRNDPVTRKMSRNGCHVTWEAHQRWFASLIGDDGRWMLIGVAEQAKIGVVRFEPVADCDNCFEISINVNPVYRRQGVGQPLLLAAIEWFRSQTNDATLIAEIKQGNSASMRIFERLGFAKVADRTEFASYQFRAA